MKYKQLLPHVAIVATATAVFLLLFRWTSGLCGDSLSVSYHLAFAGLALCTLCGTALSLAVSNHSRKAGRPSCAGLLATHIPLAFFGYVALSVVSTSSPDHYQPGLLALAVLLATCSLLSSRIWVFLTPVLANVHYEEIPAEFYHDTTKEEHVGAFRAWYHGGRYKELQSRIHSIYKPGDSIYDFGCGGAEWNQSKLPVIGVDVSQGLLQYGKDRGQLQEIVVAELDQTGLSDNCADIIIISEVIEHIVDPVRVLTEIRRCLKPGGTLLLTVPWDTPFSPFFWLFNVQCFYRGYIVGEDYYKQRCGHINHFSLKKLKSLLIETGFSVQRMYRFRGLLLYSISTK